MDTLKLFKCHTISLLTGPHCQCQGVCQGMKHISLYLWYPLTQAE